MTPNWINIVVPFLSAIIGGLFSLLAMQLSLRGKTDYFDNLALKQIKKKLKQNKDTTVNVFVNWGKSIGMNEAETKQLVFVAKGGDVPIKTDAGKEDNKTL